MKILIVFVLTFSSFSAVAQSINQTHNQTFQQNFLSPSRHPGESFESASRRQSTRVPQSHSVYEARKKLNRLDQVSLPRWESKTPLEVAFREIRDRRTLEDPSHAHFLRRVSWLFPDDGCYARAEIAAQWLEEKGYPSPAKVFVFGDLRAKTPHHPEGEVEWWYHVVVGYKTAQGLMVFDPAVDHGAPMSLKAWTDSLGDDHVTYSFCDRNSVDPYSTCQGGERADVEKTLADEERFLKYEWDRQLELGRDPSRVLGDEPPWLKLFQY